MCQHLALEMEMDPWSFLPSLPSANVQVAVSSPIFSTWQQSDLAVFAGGGIPTCFSLMCPSAAGIQKAENHQNSPQWVKIAAMPQLLFWVLPQLQGARAAVRAEQVT